jgi:DNA-binding NarL/FixJ family response regulator
MKLYSDNYQVGEALPSNLRWQDIVKFASDKQQLKDYLNYDITPQAMQKFAAKTQKIKLTGKHAGLYLTGRERNVLELLLEDLTLNEIAQTVRLSVRTIEEYGGFLRKKFGYKSNREMIATLKKDTGLYADLNLK